MSGKNDTLPTSRFVHIADSGRRVVGVHRGDGVTPVSVTINVTIKWVSLILWIFTFFLSCHTGDSGIVIRSENKVFKIYPFSATSFAKDELLWKLITLNFYLNTSPSETADPKILENV